MRRDKSSARRRDVLATRNAATYTATSTTDGTFTLALPPGVYDVNAEQRRLSRRPSSGIRRGAGRHVDVTHSARSHRRDGNNSTYGPAYTLFNSTIRFELSPGVACSTLGRALFNQGNATLRQGPGPGGTLVNAPTRAKSLQQVNPRTLRFTLQHRF